MIGKEKIEALHKRMERLGVKEEDFVEKFVLGSGSGGQKINKTSSCVYLKHIPTGIEVKCQKERSRELNRFYARKHIVEALEKVILDEKTAKEKASEKIRRQKMRKSRKQKQKMIDDKRQLSTKKQMRSAHKENL
jgi:protein subunit release factor B